MKLVIQHPLSNVHVFTLGAVNVAAPEPVVVVVVVVVEATGAS